VCAATFLGGSGANHLGSVDVAPDGTLVVAGAVEGSNLGVTPTTLMGGTTGAVVRLNSTGTKVLSMSAIGTLVSGLQVDRVDGKIAVAGDFGVALLDAVAGSILWSKAISGGASVVSIGDDGTIAALSGNTVSVFSEVGMPLGTISIPATSTNGVAVDGADQSVIVTGYRQDNGGACSEYKSTFILAYAYAGGSPKWTDYAWTHDQVGAAGQCADTTGFVVTMGRDGKLYYAAKSDGGDTVHQNDPRDLSKPAPNVATDAYNQPYGLSGANAIGYYARFDPATGLIERGQFVLSRNGSAGNAAVPSAIAADEKGDVFIAGNAAYEIDNRSSDQINGHDAGNYAAYDVFGLIVSPDFTQRLTWTVFNGGGPGTATAVVAGKGIAALGAEQTSAEYAGGALITVNALQPSPQGASDGYLAVWPAP
jgi:hypothetical protein